MPAYLFVNVDIRDESGYDQYRTGVAPLIRKHGGEALIRGGACEVFEGDWSPSRVVLIRFPSMEAIRAFLDDPDYRPLKELRQRISRGDLVGIEGM